MKLPITLFLFIVALGALTAQTETIQLKHSVYFASDSHEPDAEETDRLSAFTDQLTSYASYTLRIEAFTDERGTATYNEALAERRAAAIASLLSLRRVAAATTEVLTYGEGQARQNTTDDAERRTDRRVDLVATVERWTDAAAVIKALRDEQTQRYTIADPTQPQTVRGEQGGVFLFNANSLVTADGELATGPVTIELVEAYSFPDMLIAGLTTTSGNRLLETGGMIKLTATDAAGAELKLKLGSSVTSSIPTLNYDEGMQLFTGAGHAADGTPGDWQLTTGQVRGSAQALLPARPLRMTLEEFREKVTREVKAMTRVFGGGEKNCDFYPDVLKTREGKGYLGWLRINNRPDTPTYLNPATYRLRKYPEPVDTSAIVYQPTGMDKLLMSAKKREKLTQQRRQQALKRYARQLERYQQSVAYRDGIPAANERKRLAFEAASEEWTREAEQRQATIIESVSRQLFAINAAQRKNYEKYRQRVLAEMEDRLLTSGDLSGSEQDVRRYFFKLADLGWANCDIFLREEERVEVLASLPRSTPKANVFLLPEGRRSVINYHQQPDGTWSNRGIPRDLGYRVIAYEVHDGQLVLAHKQVAAATAGRVEALSYSPVAITELRARLAELVGS